MSRSDIVRRLRKRKIGVANADAPRADGDQDEATPQVSAALAFVQEHPLGPLAAREKPLAAAAPRLLLETGTTDRYALYSDGSGTATLTDRPRRTRVADPGRFCRQEHSQ